MSRRAPRSRRLRRPERGAAAVEFAFVLLPLLYLVFGIIQYGLYFWAMQGGSDIARGAARVAAVGTAPTCSAFQAQVTGDIGNFGGATSDGVVTRDFDKAEGNSGTVVEIGDRVAVTVEFETIDLNLPLIPLPHDGTVKEDVQARVDYLPSQPEDGCGT